MTYCKCSNYTSPQKLWVRQVPLRQKSMYNVPQGSLAHHGHTEHSALFLRSCEEWPDYFRRPVINNPFPKNLKVHHLYTPIKVKTSKYSLFSKLESNGKTSHKSCECNLNRSPQRLQVLLRDKSKTSLIRTLFPLTSKILAALYKQDWQGSNARELLWTMVIPRA